MLRSLYSGVNGVTNSQTTLDVVANNIANVNTIGYKSSRVTFADSISQLLKGSSAPRDARGGTNPVQVGLGVKVQSIDNNFGQGGLSETGYSTDLAIEGDGFFVVREGDQLFYTRAGNFTIDSQGNLVANSGSTTVQGYLADNDGNLGASLEDLVVPLQMKSPANATTEVVLYSNLDSDATEADASLDDAGDSGVTSVSGTADDGVGGTHTISISGTNATNSTAAGTSTFGGGGSLTLSTTLAAAGVTDLDGFEITLDAGTADEVTYEIGSYLDLTNTVGQMIQIMEARVAGADFELSGGEIVVTRNYAGDGTSYNVQLSDTGGTSDLVDALFGGGAAGTGGTTVFDVDTGTASTLTAVDTFVDNAYGDSTSSSLTFVADSETGLMTELEDLGSGGITITAEDGFTETVTSGNDLVIETEDTEHSTSITVYDEQGVTHNLTVTFTKTTTLNSWKWEASVDEPATTVNGSTGTVEFNSDGTLRSFNFDNNQSAFVFDPGSSQALVEITFDSGTSGGMDGITQTASSFTTQATSQDGFAMGTLEGVDIDQYGQITGSFTNGQEQLLGAIVLANFNNANGLEKEGDNLWSTTDGAGTPIYNIAGTGNSTMINSGYVEMSNVDLVDQFTEMIIAQRAFQASSRVITTADTILQEVVNLKR